MDMTHKPARIQGFIFDLDGVITDTAEYHYQAWKRLADDENLPFIREDNEHLRGISRRESLQLILNGREMPEVKIVEMMERKNGYYLELLTQITPKDLLPGAQELLEELRLAGIKIALGSASKNAREVLKRLDILYLFDVIADGFSVEYPKPAPDLFLHAAAALGLPTAACVVVEDAAAGILAAKTGGFRTVGIGPAARVGDAEVILPSLDGVSLSHLLRALEAI